MLYLLSPAKTLDFETRVPAVAARKASEPLFSAQAAELIALLKTQSAEQVAALMDLSPALAELNAARYAAWQPIATPANSRPALLAFDGDVYGGLAAHSLKAADLDWAQRHLVILSGLYGVLRPLDRLQPYRLEMGTALDNPRGKDLYAWWGDTLADHINQRQADEARPVVVNLASVEYARAAVRVSPSGRQQPEAAVLRQAPDRPQDGPASGLSPKGEHRSAKHEGSPKSLRAQVIDCVFEDWHGGEYKVISFFAKRARGLMARHVIEQRIRSPKALPGFSAEGYAYDAAVSSPQRLVFRRRVAGSA